MSDMFSEDDLQVMLDNLDQYTPEEIEEINKLVEELARRKHAQSLYDDLIEFCKHMQPDYKVGKHHRILANMLMKIESGKEDRICVNIPPRHGKQIADDTPILTPEGWVTHGELSVGDYVYHPSGKAVPILAVSDKTPSDYIVTTSEGQTIRCHANHEWTVYSRPRKAWVTMETKDFIAPVKSGPNAGQPRTLTSGQLGKRGGRYQYQLPTVMPIEGTYKLLPLDPYFLGVWLGDGRSSSPDFVYHPKDPQPLEELISRGFKVTWETTHSITGVKTAGFCKQGIKQTLRQLNIINNKHIPAQYLQADIDSRLDLLAGLIDTDGHVERSTGRVRIATCTEQLKDDIVELLTGLGQYPYVHEQLPTLSSSGIQGRQVVYYIGFQPSIDIPTKVLRKQISHLAPRRKIAIASVVYDPQGEQGHCIEIDSDDGLYLVGRSLIPTHNSQLVSIMFPAWFLGRNPDKKVMMVSHTTDLAVDFGRKVRNLIDTDTYKEVFPTVTLAKDSKSAGRWNTGVGGQYYACIQPDSLVPTPQGRQRADAIKVGGRVLTAQGFREVLAVYHTKHTQTVTINEALRCTPNHPIATTRGWVKAEEVNTSDTLLVESIFDILLVKLSGVYHGTLEHPTVQTLAKHAEPLRETVAPPIQKLRGAWDLCLRTLAELPQLRGRYGTPAVYSSHAGQKGQQRAIFSRQLPMGNAYGAESQQTHKQAVNPQREDATVICVGRGAWVESRRDSLEVENGGDVRNRADGREDEVEQREDSSEDVKLGWLRRAGVWFNKRGGKTHKPRKPEGRWQRALESVAETAQVVQGLLLGVRRVSSISTVEHDTREFINYRVADNNQYFADGVLTHNCGVGSSLAGRGADLLLIDDPHSEQDVINGNFDVFDKAYEWYTYGARTRLMPNGKVAIIQTRWHQDDLTGRVTRDMAKEKRADQFNVVEFPAILELEKDGQKYEKPLWSDFFDLEALLRTKASMPTFQWNAQYQQKPTAEEASVVKREWWQIWKKEEPPPCEFLIMSLDAAAERHNRADYTAMTTWGVFYNEEANAHHIILLNSIKKRLEFPELKALCLEEYEDWEPDSFIVEKKSAGVAIYQEMRRMGIPVQEYTPHRGSGDKMARLNSVADIFASGLVWVPETRWAEEVVEEVAGFPFMSNDDLVDSTVMAMMRFRQGGFIRLPTDEAEPEQLFRSHRRRGYY